MHRQQNIKIWGFVSAATFRQAAGSIPEVPRRTENSEIRERAKKLARGLNTGVRFSAGTCKYLFGPTRRAKRPAQPSQLPKRYLQSDSCAALTKWKIQAELFSLQLRSCQLPRSQWTLRVSSAKVMHRWSLSYTLSMAWFLPILTSLCGVLLNGE